MLPPLPRCSGWASSSLVSPNRVSLPRFHVRIGLHIVLFEALLSVHSRCGLHTRTVTVCRDRYPKASDTSSPPCLLRLLPAGAIAGRALHPLEKRRLVTAHVEDGRWRQISAAKVAPQLALDSPSFRGLDEKVRGRRALE